MIKLRHQQPSLWHRGLAEDIEELWEPWMRLVDELLEDEQLLDTVYEAQGERHPKSRSRGRMQTPAEVLLRLLCTNRDWDESRVQWPPMRDFIRARTRKRAKRWGCGGCRYPIRTPPVANGNFFSTSVGFVGGKSGGPGRRVESACSNEDTGYVVASIPVWRACDDGWGWA
jgi:hypothetical protein